MLGKSYGFPSGSFSFAILVAKLRNAIIHKHVVKHFRMKKLVTFWRQILSYIGIKFCPYCGRELRTNKSKQCSYCYKSWHNNLVSPSSGIKGLLPNIKNKEFHDKKDSRQPEEFDLLVSAKTFASDNRNEFINLCNEQIILTPDYDLPYIWVSNGQNALGNTNDSITILIKGLGCCKKLSGILNKLGERYLFEIIDIELSITLFSKAIMAQEPPRSDHVSYLYFAYICIYSDYGNAGKKALKIARKIYGLGDIDLDNKTQFDIKTIIESDYKRCQSLVIHFLQILIEQNRLD